MDDDQQFCLRWNNHQSTLVSVFDTLLEKGMHVDCTLAAEGQTLKAHKVVLSACSPYFENVLSQQYDKHPIIILKDVKYAELRAMMDYMYRGEVNISQDQLAALLKAAESLQIKGLSDNKPSRPPSRPPPAAHPHPPHQPHPPRAPSPPPQVRDGSIDSREGSVSPTRRRKKARRASTEVPVTPLAPLAPLAPAVIPPPEPPASANGDDCKEETQRDGVEDLTIDEEADDQPNVTHNDVVRNFQWHMERSQDELMNSSDSVRDSQEKHPKKLTCTFIFGKTSYPLTRGYLRSFNSREEKVTAKARKDAKTKLNRECRSVDGRIKPKPLQKLTKENVRSTDVKEEDVNFKPPVDVITPLTLTPSNKSTDGRDEEKVDVKPRRGRKPLPSHLKNPKRASKKLKHADKKLKSASKKRGRKPKDNGETDQSGKKYICSLCHNKYYKYRRNKLRHEKYECMKGPQFPCLLCDKRYSQKKTLTAHFALKHPEFDPKPEPEFEPKPELEFEPKPETTDLP